MINEIRKELKKNVDQKYKKRNRGYFKEEIKCYGVKTPLVRKIAKKYFNKIKHLPKTDIFYFCEELFKSGYNEEATIAIQWISEINLEAQDFETLDKWLDKYITNWGSCDDYCLSVVSHFIIRFPRYRNNIKLWSKSKNRWKKRASAVSFIQGGNWKIKDEYLKDVFEVAEILLKNEDDLVQKGYGWMLKVASMTNQKEVFDFVIKHKKEMPRTALRYAIEKMPDNMRKKAMEK